MLDAPSQRAASTIKASIQFAAALCEISGGFLIFASAPYISQGLRLIDAEGTPTTTRRLPTKVRQINIAYQ